MKNLSYKKFFVFFTAVIISSTMLTAQTTITIGSQTVASGTSNISPYNYYWESRRVQFVYTAAEITAAGGSAGMISAIAWDVSELNGGDLLNYEIKLAHTTATDASSHNTATLTTVKAAHTFTPGSAGWRTITFDAYFNWNGVDNILVDVCWGVNSGYGSNGQVWMYNNASAQTRSVNSVSTNQCGQTTTGTRTYKPRVQFTFDAACNAPVAVITQNCAPDYLSYSLQVVVTDLGDAAGVDITDGTTTFYSNVGLGTYYVNSLTAGKTIYVRDHSVTTCQYSQTFTMCDICSGTSVPSDECADAPIIDLSQPFAGSTDCTYTPGAGSPDVCGQSVDNDSWMRFIAASTEVEIDFTVGTCTPQNRGIQLAVFSGTCGSLSLVPGSCDGPGTYGDNAGLTSTWHFSGMTIGETYYIRIDGYAGDLCDYYFEPVSGVVITPDNDECANAKVINCGDSDIASNILATAIDAPAGCVGGGTPSKGIWYTFTGTGETVTISTDNPGTNFDTQINVFSGSCGSLVCVGGDDDSGTGTTSSFTFTATNSADYFIYVDGDGTAEGQFEISLECCNVTPGITNNTGTTVLDCSTISISVTATGGTSYTWSGGNSTTTAGNSFGSPGNYTVTVTDGSCTATAGISIIQDIAVPTAVITNNTGTNVLDCSTTSVSLTASGGESYVWSGGSSLSTDVNSVSLPDTYSVTVTASNGCSDTENITITQDIVVPVAVITNNTGTTVLDCSTTSVSLTAGGGVSYLWSGGSSTTTDVNTISTPDTYIVTVTASNGCTDTESITITQDVVAPVAAITNNTGTTVLDCSTTSVSLTANGGASYLWSGGSSLSTDVNAVSMPDTYTVTVTASNGCTDTESIIITQDVVAPVAAITNNTGTTVLDCSTTSVSLTASGGVSYLWSGGSSTTTDVNTVSIPDIYTVTVTASNGCTDTESITITQDVVVPVAAITNNTGTTVLDCSTTSISLTASGGASYVWSGGSSLSTDVNTISIPDTYTVTVTASNGCTDTESITITQDVVAPVAAITNNTGTTALDCSTTSISLTASGGASYVWSGGSSTTTDVNTILTPDTYTVTVTASNGCTDTESITITQDAVVPVAAILNNTGTIVLDCSTTSISLTASGGTSYVWSGGSSLSTDANTVSSPDTYTVTVTSSNGCTDTESITITQNAVAPVAAITNNTGITVLDCSITSISLTASGGVSYVWSGGLSTTTDVNTFSSPDTYTVTVTSSNGCTDTGSITITQDVVAPVATITNNTGATVLDCSTTSVSLTASGGASYVWSGGSSLSTDANTVSIPDTYTVTVTASNGCSDTESITITQDAVAPVAAIINNTGTTVLDCSTTSISLTASGGVSYVWSGGSSTTTDVNTISTPDTYTVTVTSSNGCTDTESITITQDVVAPVATITNNTGTAVLDCSTTSISLTASGGASYVWSGGSSTTTDVNTFSTPDTYIVTVTASNGCTDTESITITQDVVVPVAVITNNTGTTVLDCSTTSISLTASGGASYVWSGGSSTITDVNTVSTPDTYTVTVTASNGCTDTESITITQDVVAPVAAITNNTGTTVLDCSTTSISLTASGGTSYVWSGGSSTTTDVNTVSIPDTYTVTVTASNGCSDTESITITQDIVVPVAAITNNTGTTVLDCSTTSISLTASGGTSYVWSGGSSLSTDVNAISTPDTYTVTVTSSNGCTDTESITITQDAVAPVAAIINNTGTTVLDCSTTSISLTASGGVSYVWSGGSSTTTDANIVSTPDTYTVTVTSSNGCTDTESITITRDVEVPVTDLGADITVCETDVPVIFDAGAGFSYEWSNGLTTQTISASNPGLYSVTITAGNSCTATDNINLTVNTVVIPAFGTFGPYCINAVADELPVISDNLISGTWTPSVISTAVAGVNTYLFVADEGQCAQNYNQEVEVKPVIIPVFDSFGPYCEGEEADILPDKSNNNIGGSWSPAVINTLINGEDEYLFTPSENSECYGSVSVLISIHSYPQISIVPEEAEIYPSETLNISVSGADTYSWSPSGVLSCDNCSDPFFYSPLTQSTDSVYMFYLTATSDGCTVTDSVSVKVLADAKLIIPQGFSPNGDGKGDTWIITGIERYPENELYVYNRWGALVYSQKSYNNDWAGKLNSDEKLPDGTYYYVLKLTGSTEDVYKGYVYIAE